MKIIFLEHSSSENHLQLLIACMDILKITVILFHTNTLNITVDVLLTLTYRLHLECNLCLGF